MSSSDAEFLKGFSAGAACLNVYLREYGRNAARDKVMELRYDMFKLYLSSEDAFDHGVWRALSSGWGN